MPLAPSPRPPRSVLLVAATDVMSYARMPRLFADAGMRVTIMAPASSAAFRSSYARERIPVPADPQIVCRRLRSLLARDPARFDEVVVCDEDLLAEVARRLDESWALGCFPASPDAARIVTQKTRFIAACQDAGIAVPASRVCRDGHEARALAAEIGFPLVLKADFGASGTTVWRIDGETALAEALPRTAGRPFLLQQLLVGEAGVTEMLCRHGTATAIVSSAMRGIDPKPFGPASSRAFRRVEAAEALAARIATLTGFHGLCGFDWIQTEGADGPVHAIEFHPRPTLGFHFGRKVGVDFAAALAELAELAEGNAAPRVQREGAETECLFFPKDLTRALRTRDLGGLVRWIPGVAATDFPWLDPGLLAGLAARAIAGRRRGATARGATGGAPVTLAHSTAFGDDV